MCFCQITWSVVDFRFFDDVTSGCLVFMLGRAGLVPKTRSQTFRITYAVKLVTWYKIRPSDWSIQKILQSDWLVRIPPPYTTFESWYFVLINHYSC